MDIRIDTNNKTITIESEVTLHDLWEGLQDLLGSNWREYRLIPKDIGHTNREIYLPPRTPYDNDFPEPTKIWYTTGTDINFNNPNGLYDVKF